MQDNKQAFTRFLISAGALQFGSFVLKSGRVSPYFFNATQFNSGGLISRLGDFYADAIREKSPECTSVFGPAYKGIPLCVAVAQALSSVVEKDIGYFFNRKEKKTHGDQGLFVGKTPHAQDTIVLVDDVITDGRTKIEAVEMVKRHFGTQVSSVLVALDRMELSAEGADAKIQFEDKTGIPVHALITIHEIRSHLKRSLETENPLTDPETLKKMEEYLARHCFLPGLRKNATTPAGHAED